VQGEESKQTESERILAMVMNDIRSCDKETPYGYDVKKRTVSPDYLNKIKGFKLRRLSKEIAIFDIDEKYENLNTKMLWVLRTPAPYKHPMHAVGFINDYKTVRNALGRVWNISFEDAVLPAATYDGPSARFAMTINGKFRELSIEHKPATVYPNINLPIAGCNLVSN
jgi:hypothetical protein